MKSLKDIINENANESIPEGSVKNLVRSLVGLLSTDSDRNKYKKMAEIFYDSLKEASNEDSKKEALIETGKIAEKAFNRRTELMSEKADKTNRKLDELMQKYKTSIEVEDNAE